MYMRRRRRRRPPPKKKLFLLHGGEIGLGMRMAKCLLSMVWKLYTRGLQLAKISPPTPTLFFFSRSGFHPCGAYMKREKKEKNHHVLWACII